MTIRFLSHSTFQTRFKKIIFAFWAILSLLILCLISGCKSAMDYTPYISELRSNIFLAEAEELSLRIYAVDKEIPYKADGIAREKTTRLEAYLHAPDGSKPCQLTVSFDDKDFCGEMSFDNVKAEYFFSCTLDVSKATELPCRIEYGDKTVEMSARSVCNESTLTASNILSILQEEEQELFSSMTDKYGFAGEIYIRLIYENSSYYYVGIVERSGTIHAFLLNAQSGKVLAKRTM